MSIRIKILPEDLINKIAAGEVVERPASVVKELVENAIDAGGREISVDIRGGGRSQIQVVDDGLGMSRDEALLAVERHATSKIANDADLFNIRTLGFRGEALAAIAGVSRLEIVTRTREAVEAARLSLQGGTVRSVDVVGAPPGTSITVRDLFFNTPARLKFLKSAAIETGHIIDLMTRLALSHDNLGMRLLRGPEVLLQVSQVTTGRDRLVEVLGHDFARALYPFEGERAGVRVYGQLSAPELSRSGWSGLYAFVNKRFMRDRVVSKAIAEAYRGVIPKGRYPVVVLYLELDPKEVDVNVHPGKIEVRFARPRLVSDLIIDTLRAAIRRTPWRAGARSTDESARYLERALEPEQQVLAAELLREDALAFLDEDSPQISPAATETDGPAGAMAMTSSLEPGGAARPRRLVDFSKAPEPDEEAARLESLATQELSRRTDQETTWGQEDWGWRRERWRERQETHEPAATPGQTAPPPMASRVQGGGVNHPPPSTPLAAAPSIRQSPAETPRTEVPSADESLLEGLEQSRSSDAGHPSRTVPDPTGLVPQEVQDPGPEEIPPSLAPASAPSPVGFSHSSLPTERLRERPGILPTFEARNFSRMRVIGQYANCFILCQDGDELVIIDQHAAHERVTFEQLKQAYEGVGAQNQLLLTPQIVTLQRRDAEVLKDYLEELEKMGLEIEPYGGSTFAVKAIPAPLIDDDPTSMLTELAADLSGEVARQPLQERIYLILATMACHGSIRANRRMTPPEMDALLKLLDGTDFSFACPHGRPLIVRSTRREIEKLFKRT